MNCKPGDLAVLVRSTAGNEGKIVRCLRMASNAELDSIGWRERLRPAWFIDPPLRSNHGEMLPFAADAFLRPIRDPGDDAVDESFRWAPAPEKVTV